MIKIPKRVVASPFLFQQIRSNCCFPHHVLVLCLCSLCFQNVGCREPVIASLSSVQGLISAYVPQAALEIKTGAIIYTF